MKIYKINGRGIHAEHKVVSDEKTHHVSIRCKFSHESGKTIEHVLTIGAEGAAPVGLTKESLQKTLDDFKAKHAKIFAAKIHAAEIAAGLEE